MAVAMGLCAVLVAAAVAAALLVAEALEERDVATAAVEIGLSAQQVAAGERMISLGADPSDLVHLHDAATALAGTHSKALHSLPDAERSRAEALLAALSSRHEVPTGQDRTADHLEAHEELISLLRAATDLAREKAGVAERRAIIIVLLGALAAVAAAWLLLRSRASELSLRQELTRQAATDQLTGLSNRRVLGQVLDKARSDMVATGGTTGLVVMDLDGFKEVNDSLGHGAGDRLLILVAERLLGAQRQGEVILRLGGDEFAVVLHRIPAPEAAYSAAQRYLSVFAEPFQLGGDSEHLRASMGVTTTSDPERVGALTAEADVAMYRAKQVGGHRVTVFETAMDHDAGAFGHIARALRAADFDAEFSLHYQPVVPIDDDDPVSYEALLRWESPLIGRIGPAEFIPVAERAGEICAIGRWVVDRVCARISTWDDEGRSPALRISCNVSPIQLEEPDFVPELLGIVDGWGIDRNRLILEVTESAVLGSSGAAVARLAALREAGFRVAIDDFGSGYSNLGQLLRVPLDMIKIDRSLLLMLSDMRERSGGDPTGPCAIMSAIVSIASVFQAPVVCEGVETEAQRRSLLASGITHVQGYLVGRPAPPEEAFAATDRRTVRALSPVD